MLLGSDHFDTIGARTVCMEQRAVEPEKVGAPCKLGEKCSGAPTQSDNVEGCRQRLSTREI